MGDINRLHNAVRLLARLRHPRESVKDYCDELRKRIIAVMEILPPNDSLVYLDKQLNEMPCFVWTGTALRVLLAVAKATRVDTVTCLLTTPQQQNIKMVLQMIFSLGVLPALKPGVDEVLLNVSIKLLLKFPEEWPVSENYEMLCRILRVLIGLINYPNMRSLILTHLRDILGALLQIIHCDNEDDLRLASPSELDRWRRKKIQYKVEFRKAYNELTEGLYKPLVIKELLILLAVNKQNGKGVPQWLERAITRQLDNYLLRPGGVALTMRACYPSTSETVDWKKVEIMSRLISVVHGNVSQDHFYSVISPQVIALLNTTGHYCVPVAKVSIKSILERDPERCTQYIFNKLFEPFVMCSKPVCDRFAGTLISEESIGRCLEHIMKCFEDGSCESSLPMHPLITIVKIQFLLYMKVKDSPYQHKTALQDLLVRFLYSENDSDRLKAIYNSLLFDEPDPKILDMNKELTFEFGPSGGVQVVKGTVDLEADKPINFEIHEKQMLKNSEMCIALLSLLCKNESYNKKLLHDLFVVLLTSLSDFLNSPVKADYINPASALDVEDVVLRIVSQNKKRLMTICLLEDLSETPQVMDYIKNQPILVLKFVVKIFEKKAVHFENHQTETESSVDDTTCAYTALRFIELLTSDLKPTSDTWHLFNPLLKPLRIVARHMPDVASIALPLIERILLKQGLDVDKSKLTDAEIDKAQYPSTYSLDSVLDLILSSDVPTKSRGLAELRNLIKTSNKEVTNRKNEIFVLLKKQLQHMDSYVYLRAISTFEAMCYINADEVIELLCEEYVKVGNAEAAWEQFGVGEVLVRISRNIMHLNKNAMSRMINTFLFGAKSINDNMFRSSCLSNLAEVLKNFKYACGPILQEVVTSMQNIIATDKCSDVRRSALLLIVYLIEGHSDSSFTDLESALKDLYNLLRHVRDTDQDPFLQRQAEVGLNKIAEAVKSQFAMPTKLEKRIAILGLD